MNCAICQNALEGSQSLTLPECGHCFHSQCVTHWFRVSSPSCPLCREVPVQVRDRQAWDTSSTSSSSVDWTFVTPTEAHRQVWRLLTPLSRTQPRLVKRYRAVWTRLKEQKQDLLRFQRTARGYFRDLRKKEGVLHRRVQRTSEVHVNLANDLLEAAPLGE